MREWSTSMMAAARPASSIPPSPSAPGPSCSASKRRTRVAVCGVLPAASAAARAASSVSGSAVLSSSFRTT